MTAREKTGTLFLYIFWCVFSTFKPAFYVVFLTNTKSSLWTVCHPKSEKSLPFCEIKVSFFFLIQHYKDIYLGSIIEHCVFGKVQLNRHNIILSFKYPKEIWKAINISSKWPTLFLHMNLYIGKFLWDSGYHSQVIPPTHFPQDIYILSVALSSWT